MLIFKLLLLLKAAAAMNVIVMADVMVCDLHSSNEIIDGQLFELSDTIERSCRGYPDITVTLQNIFFIHYIDLYGGESRTNGTIKFGGNYIVNLNTYDPHSTCIYWKIKHLDFQAMRANCMLMAKTREFYIKFKNTPFYVSEIEAHNLERSVEEPLLIYRGCYKKFPSLEYVKADAARCRRYCFMLKKYIYFALKGSICSCANKTDDATEQPLENCDLTCSASKDKCGGIGLFSVYIGYVQLPSLRGCENKTLNSTEESNDMTVEKCIKLCDRSYYASLRDGRHCACSNDTIGKNITDFASCNKPCSGDSSSYCGGEYSWSIYSTCLNKYEPSLPCSELFHCSESWDELGLCREDCRDGYFGEHCVHRGTFRYVEEQCFPNPCEDPNSYCIYSEISGKQSCACTKGYKKVEHKYESKDKFCQDIDECLADPCDKQKSTCKNVEGTYECTCHSDYYQLTSTTCKALEKKAKQADQPIAIMLVLVTIFVGLTVIGITLKYVLKKKK